MSRGVLQDAQNEWDEAASFMDGTERAVQRRGKWRLSASRKRVAAFQRRETAEVTIRRPQAFNPVLQTYSRNSGIVNPRTRDSAVQHYLTQALPVAGAFTDQA